MLSIKRADFPQLVSKIVLDVGLELEEVHLQAAMQAWADFISANLSTKNKQNRLMEAVIDMAILDAERRIDGWEEHLQQRFLLLPRKKLTDEQLELLIQDRAIALKERWGRQIKRRGN